jgi:Holliday junction resolvasome RuvABC DNA-binding subunit
LAEAAPQGTRALEGLLQSSVAGVGPKTAALLVDAFGPSITDVLNAPDAEKRLRTVHGIGPKLAEKIRHSWLQGRGEACGTWGTHAGYRLGFLPCALQP